MSDDRHVRVSRRAYELWEQQGGRHGHHEDHWHRASAEVDEQVATPAGTTPAAATDPLDAPAPPEKPARKRAAPRTAADAEPAAAAPKTPAKPRKPKAK